MSNLYRVTVEKELVVEADDEHRARSIARDRCKREQPGFVTVRPCESTDDLPNGWEAKSIPWGSDDDTRLGEKLEATDE